MENLRNSAIGKAARNLRTSLRPNSHDEFFETLSAFKKHYDDTETKTIREFHSRFSIDIPDRPVAQKVRPAVESWNLESLYVQVLASLLNTLESVSQDESESLVAYLKTTFHFDAEAHLKLIDLARRKEPNFILNVEIVKASDLRGKDANGLSDPFCILSVSHSPEEVQYTSTEEATLNPIWAEHFSFPIRNIQDDILHVEVWDYDPQESLTEKVVRLSEVQSARGLRNLFVEIAAFASAAGKQKNQFLASLQIPIREIPVDGYEKWFNMESSRRNKATGEIFLRMAVAGKKDKNTILKEYRHVIYLILAHELAEKDNQQYAWDGEFSSHARLILKQLQMQGGLLPLDDVLAQWVVFIRVHCQLALDARLFPRTLNVILEHFQNADSPEAKDVNPRDIKMFWDSCETLLESFASFLCNSSQYFLVDSAAIFQVQNIIRTVLILKSYLSKGPPNINSLSADMINEKMVNAISCGAETMFNHIKSETATGKCEVQFAVKIGQQLIADLQKRFQLLDSDFKDLLEIRYYETFYRVYDKKLAEMVEPLATQLCEEFQSATVKGGSRLSLDLTTMTTGTSLLELYLVLKSFSDLSSHIVSQDGLHIKGVFHSWFHSAVRYWLDIASSEAENRIDKAVQHDDSLTPITNYDNRGYITATAADIRLILEPVVRFWNQLSWPEIIESYEFVLKIVQDLFKLSTHFAYKIMKKVEQAERSREKTFLLTHELCFAITSIEHVIREVGLIGERFEADILEKLKRTNAPSVEFCQTLKDTLKSCNDKAVTEAFKIIGNVVALHMEPIIFKLLVDDVESNIDYVAFDSTCDYLTDNLAKLKKNLTSAGFDKLVGVIWESVSKALKNVVERSVKKQRSLVYFQRIEKILEMLSKVVFPKGTSEVQAQYQNEDIQEVLDTIRLFETPTNDLIMKYTQERLRQQNKLDVCTSKNGVLVIRSAYFDDGGILRVEIIGCQDLKASDINGFSDPYVKLTVTPLDLKPAVNKKTKVQERTLSPIFNEMFSIALTQEQMLSNGILHFCVKDYDRIKKNDYIGEAFLPLEATRLFDDLRTTSAVKLADVPLVHIPLSLPDSSVYRLLQVLECRPEDSRAAKFSKQERLKIA